MLYMGRNKNVIIVGYVVNHASIVLIFYNTLFGDWQTSWDSSSSLAFPTYKYFLFPDITAVIFYYILRYNKMCREK